MNRPDPDKIQAAIELIDTPEKWTKGSFAKAADGFHTSPHFESNPFPPSCFCALGALMAAGCERMGPEARLLSKVIDNGFVPHWNDAHCRQHHEVIAAMMQARDIAQTGVVVQ